MAENSLSGVWFGIYRYPRDLAPPVNFLAHIVHEQDVITGKTSEPNTFAGSSTILYADINGSVDRHSVFFIKYYNAAGDAAHSAHYNGHVSADRTLISGKWNIAEFAGSFEMSRQDHREALENETFEEITLNRY